MRLYFSTSHCFIEQRKSTQSPVLLCVLEPGVQVVSIFVRLLCDMLLLENFPSEQPLSWSFRVVFIPLCTSACELFMNSCSSKLLVDE